MTGEITPRWWHWRGPCHLSAICRYTTLTFLTLTMEVDCMVLSDALDFGRCPCSGQYDVRWIDVSMTVEGNRILLTDVPQGVCPLCGSQVYKAEVLEQIESLMKGEQVV